MSPNPTKKRLRIKIITKPALIRLAILLAILLILSIWGWFTLFWMPEQSYQGQLAPLQKSEITLKNALQQDVKN
jgi:Tfp pilus assembly protein PilO